MFPRATENAVAVRYLPTAVDIPIWTNLVQFLCVE